MIETKTKKYARATLWVFLSLILILMAGISTVESLTVYYTQLVVIAILSLLGIATGVGFALGRSWANVLAKYLKYVFVGYFAGSLLIIALLMGYKMIFSAS